MGGGMNETTAVTATTDLTDTCARLIDLARKAGADAAEAVAHSSRSLGVSVRLGALEDVSRSEEDELGLRVFVGTRTASINLSGQQADLAEVVERAVAMARAAPEDPYARLARPDELAQPPFADCDAADPREPSPEELRAAAEEAEDAGRAVEGVTNSDGAGCEYSSARLAIATSEGFVGELAGTSHVIGCSLVGGSGSDKQRDYEQRAARHREDLPAPADIGREAARRTVARLGSGRLKSGAMPVVFDTRIGASLIGHLIGAMSGAAAARRSTFLLERMGETLFDSGIHVVEEPHRKRGLRSRPFDGEGLPTADRVLVDAGAPTGWLTNLSAAEQLGIAPTGHASRGSAGAAGIGVSNVTLRPGTVSRRELMADIEDGVFVTELIGQGVNSVTGDYSRGAAGYRIRGGEIAGPVAEFTIAGNLIDMFAALVPADDLETWRALAVPTLRIDGMRIAGE